MSELSKWANVALLARSGRLLEPFLEQTWSQGPRTAIALYVHALTLCEASAAKAMCEDGVSETETELTMLVGNLELHLSGLLAGITRPMPSFEAFRPYIPNSDADTKIVRDILDVGARGVRVASATDAQSIEQETMDGLSWAYSVMESLGDTRLIDELTATTDQLKSECSAKFTDDSTTVQWVDERWDVSSRNEPWWQFWKS